MDAKTTGGLTHGQKLRTIETIRHTFNIVYC